MADNEDSPNSVMRTSGQSDLFGDSADVCVVGHDDCKPSLDRLENRRFVRFCERHYALMRKLSDIGLPEPGEQFRIVTFRAFNSIQMIEYIARRQVILDMKLAVYSINFNAALILVDLIDEGRIKQVEILMSNLRNKAHREKEEVIRKLFSGHPNIDLWFCSSHAKIFSCQTAQDNFYTIEGSGNMAFNSRVEQYVIDNDRGMYEFCCEWMRDIKVALHGKKELEIC